jgi:hypothetical protein
LENLGEPVMLVRSPMTRKPEAAEDVEEDTEEYFYRR